ncbi:unnamed protein product, partial [Rotaria sp. Silwood1]
MAEEVYLVSSTTGKRYRLDGCRPSTTPSNLPKYASSRKFADKDLPALVDLRSMMTAVEDQQDTNACDAETNGGIVPMPQPDEAINDNHGTHAMLAVGYSDRAKCFIVRNSWGTEW